MVMHHFGSDIDQLAIIDVLRTSNESGTQSYDIVRGGHFSVLSSTPEQYLVLFPDVAPKRGWNSKGRQMGYASFGYRHNGSCYLDDLIPILDHGIPVIVLMAFSEQDWGGHYRVTTGYEIVNGDYLMHLLDPWDRKGNARIQKFTRQQFCKLWSYREPIKSPFKTIREQKKNVNRASILDDRERFDPYFAAVMYPWSVNVRFNLDNNYIISTDPGSIIIVNATISYPCYRPFCEANKKLIAEKSAATIYYPDYFRLINGDKDLIELGNMAPGETRFVSWHFFVSDTKGGMLEDTIKVVASGKVSSSVPEMWYNPQISMPGYNYTDLIGGEGFVHY